VAKRTPNLSKNSTLTILATTTPTLASTTNCSSKNNALSLALTTVGAGSWIAAQSLQSTSVFRITSALLMIESGEISKSCKLKKEDLFKKF